MYFFNSENLFLLLKCSRLISIHLTGQNNVRELTFQFSKLSIFTLVCNNILKRGPQEGCGGVDSTTHTHQVLPRGEKVVDALCLYI